MIGARIGARVGAQVGAQVDGDPLGGNGTLGGIIAGQSNPTTAGALASSLSGGNIGLDAAYPNIPIVFQTGVVGVNTAVTWRYYDGCSIHASNGIATLRQPLTTFRMLIFTKG